MRRVSAVVVAVLTAAGALGACSSSAKSSGPAATTTVATPPHLAVVDVASAGRQPIDAFGASGAWWPIDLAHFPQSTRDKLAQLLFDPNQLALSGYRYNIGGGGKGVTDPSRAPQQVPNDAAGLAFLKAAAAQHVPVLTGFVNSAPPQYTTNGKTCGGSLKPGAEASYARYVVDMLKQIQANDHVTLNYVSPFNEPDDSFPTCGQEGMQVPVTQRATVVQALGKALAQSGLPTKIVADESASTVQFRGEVPTWMSVPGTAQYVAALDHHTYEYPSPAVLRANVPPVAEQFDKPTWMSEICCYSTDGGADYDPTMTQGLWLADDIYNDFTFAGERAYYWWLAASQKIGCDINTSPSCAQQENHEGYNDGLVYYDAQAKNTNLVLVKRFGVFAQFSRFVRPGAVLHAVTGTPKGVRAMAFENDDHWSVVVWNEGTTSQQLGIELPTPAAPIAAVHTDPHADAQPTAVPVRTASGSWLVTLPASSITTYTFK